MNILEFISADIESNFERGSGKASFVYSFLFNHGFQLLVLLRISQLLFSYGFCGRFLSRMFLGVIGYVFGCYISPLAKIGKGLKLPHPIGIVIGDGVSIGENVTVYQNVTLGSLKASELQYPCLHDRVYVGAGAVIIGGVMIGQDCVIGANSTVNKSFPRGSVVVGSPAKLVKSKFG